MSITKLNNLSVSALTALPSGVGGKVLQVQSFTYGTEETTSSTSFVASSLTKSSTPSSASNKILIMVSGTQATSGPASECIATIFRGATNLGNSYGISYTYNVSNANHSGISMNYLDSPNTTSSTTYTMYFKATGAHAQYVQRNGALSTIILMEISA